MTAAPAPMFVSCRSCGATVFWMWTVAYNKLMPVDADPVPDGTLVLTSDRRVAVAGDQEEPDRPRYRSHFSTCPDAAGWRSRGT